MAFLTREDYLAQIDSTDLEALSMADSPTQDEAPVEVDPEAPPVASIREVAERNALDEVASYLRGRFDMVAAYALAGQARSQQLVMICVDVAIWHMCPRVAFRNVSEVREKRYLAAIKWLTMAQTGKSNPDLPLYAVDALAPQKHTFKWGSQPARSQDY
jgi:phage gp36-like protein